jgi:hypothetical protein
MEERAMEFSEDFRKRLKAELPKKLHEAIEGSDCIEVTLFLEPYTKFFFSVEEVIRLDEKGEDIIKIAKEVANFKRLHEELEEEWIRQNCSLITAKNPA